MSQIQQLEEAIRRAAAANDGEAVRALGNELRRLSAPAEMDFGEPPPGVVIHGAQGSTVAGRPDLGVDTRGMDMRQRDVASRALAARASSDGSARRAMPVFQGLSLSGGDEAVSGAYGVLGLLRGRDFGNEFDFAQEYQRQELEQTRAERPIESIVTQVGGNVVTGVGMGAAGLLPSLAGRSLAGQAAVGSATGAALGGVDGFLSGSGGKDRTTKAMTGAGIGAAAGAIVPFAIAGTRAGVQRIADSATTNRMLEKIGVSRPAADQLRRSLEADAGSTARNLRQAGPDAMLADAGPASRGMLDTAIQRSGQAGNRTIDAINRRVANSLKNATRKLDEVLGNPRGVGEASRDIRQGTATARSTAYDAAYARPIDYSSNTGRQIEALFPRIPRQAIREANALMKLNGEQSRQILINIGDDGNVVFRQMPDVRQLDYITRGLKQVAENLDGTGAMAGQSTKGLAFENLANDLRKALRNAIPEYDIALRTAREPIQQIQGMKLGYGLLRPGVTRDTVRMEVERMTPPQLEAVRMGVRSYIDDMLANVKTAASNIDKEGLPQLRKLLGELSSRSAQDKLRAIIPDAREYVALSREIDRASRSLLLAAETAANSRTFGRAATAQGVRDSLAPGPAGRAVRGEPLKMSQSAVQRFFGTTPQDDIAREDQVWSEIARFLTDPRNAVPTRRADQALMDAYRVGTRNELLADSVAKPLGLTIGSGAYQSGRQLIDR